jgi:hypothetical protein
VWCGMWKLNKHDANSSENGKSFKLKLKMKILFYEKNQLKMEKSNPHEKLLEKKSTQIAIN